MAVSTAQRRVQRAQVYDLPLPSRPCRKVQHHLCEGRGRCVCHQCMATRAYADPDLFTKRELAGIAFDGARRAQGFRQAPRRLRTRCAACGGTLKALRRSKRYCSEACAKAAQRARRRAEASGTTLAAGEAARELDVVEESGGSGAGMKMPPADRTGGTRGIGLLGLWLGLGLDEPAVDLDPVAVLCRSDLETACGCEGSELALADGLL